MFFSGFQEQDSSGTVFRTSTARVQVRHSQDWAAKGGGKEKREGTKKGFESQKTNPKHSTEHTYLGRNQNQNQALYFAAPDFTVR